MGLPRIQEIWHEWHLPGKVIGCTPGEWGDEETFDTRGQEIQRWLEDNAVEPYRFVIIDDFIKRQFNLFAPFTSLAVSVSTKFLAPPFS